LILRRAISLWGPPAAFMVLLFLVSAQPSITGPEAGWDKLAHVVAYLVFGILCLRATHAGFGILRLRPTLLALGLAVSYGLVDEAHQSLVPGRDASVLDWVADVAGVGLAAALLGLTFPRRGPSAGAPPGRVARESEQG
jgi:VanZ family protein